MLHRREFLKHLFWILGIGGLSAGSGWFFSHRKRGEKEVWELKDHRRGLSLATGVVITHGKDYARMVRAILEAFGGMEALMKPGDIVLIKPNASWARTVEQGACTHPEIIKTLVQEAVRCGAREVWVVDHPCNDPQRSFELSQIRQATLQAGGKVIVPKTYDPVAFHGKKVKVFPVGKAYLKADRMINVPVVKHHALAKMTAGMKNWYGLLGGRRNRLHQAIDACIVDLAKAAKPTFTFLDATRILMQNGPQGGRLSDVRWEHAIAGGTDEVALDAWATHLLGLSFQQVGYIPLGAAYGLGNTNYKAILKKEITLAS